MHSIFIVLSVSLYLVVSTSADVIIYTSVGYKVTLYNYDPNFPQDTRKRVVDTYFITMPQMCNRFNNSTGCSYGVSVIIDINYNGVAYTSGTTVTISAAWLQNNPQDTDVLTHECMHVVQAYPPYNPSWLVEGIADYARYKYGVNNAAAGWSLPNYASGQSYTDSYRVTARFLVWCEKGYPTIVNRLDSALRNNTYQASTWSQITGKTVDQLWFSYSRNPGL